MFSLGLGCVKDLEKKLVVITGCDSGFGFSFALYCCQQLGMVVVATCHNAHGDSGAQQLEESGCHVVRSESVARKDSSESCDPLFVDTRL